MSFLDDLNATFERRVASGEVTGFSGFVQTLGYGILNLPTVLTESIVAKPAEVVQQQVAEPALNLIPFAGSSLGGGLSNLLTEAGEGIGDAMGGMGLGKWLIPAAALGAVVFLSGRRR